MMRRFLSGLFVLLAATTLAYAEPKIAVSAALDVSALQPGKPARLAIVLEIPDHYHAQSNKPLADNLIPLTVKMTEHPGVKFGTIVYPPGKIEEYPALGKLSVYSGKTIVVVPVQVLESAKPETIKLAGTVRLQVCDDKACYRPQNRPFELEAKVVSASEAVSPQNAELFPEVEAVPTPTPGDVAAAPAASSSSSNQFSFSLLGFTGSIASIQGALLAAFIAGIIFNVMPCVLPVLPLKAIGFYEVSQHHRGRTIALGTAFSLGLIGVFAALGLVVVVSKQAFNTQFSWGQWFSIPWFVWGMSALLIVLGLWLMGAFSALQLPMGVYGLNFRHDTLPGNVQWGALTAVLSTPCTAPLLPVVIAFAITQPLWVAFATVVMVGIGMAAPYFILSAFPELAKRFPRTGPFSELVKQMTAFLLFGSAAFFIGSTFRGEHVQAWLIVGVALAASIYLIYRTTTLYKTQTAIAVACVFAILISGVSLWAAWPEKHAIDTPWVEYTDEAFKKARAENKPVLVKFTAKWCLNCIALEKTVYRDERVVDAIKKNDVVPMKLDVDHVGWDLLNHLAPGAGIPFTAIYKPGSDTPNTLASVHDSKTLIDAIQAR